MPRKTLTPSRSDLTAQRLLDGELDPAAVREIESRLAQDDLLRAQVDAWRQIDRWLDDRPQPDPVPDARPAVLTRVDADLPRRRRFPRWLLAPANLSAPAWGVAGALVGLMFLMWAHSSPLSPRRVSESEMELAAVLLLPEDLAVMADRYVPANPDGEP